MWAPTGLAEALGTWRVFNFAINRKPLMGGLVLATISPVAFLFFNWAMYGRWIPLSYQWYSALYGDLLLALFGTYCLWVAQPLALLREPRIQRQRWHWAVVCFWAGFSVWHMWSERATVSLGQHLGFSSLYHNVVVYVTLGYILTMLLLAPLKYNSYLGNAVTLLVFVLCVGGWVWLGFYDGAHQYAPNGVLKATYATPTDGWHNVRIAGVWLWHVVHGFATSRF